MGNQWAWWGDPDAAAAAGGPGRRHRVAPRLGARRRGVRRPARGGRRARRRRRAAARAASSPPARSGSSTSPTRRAPGSASPAPARASSPGRWAPTGRAVSPTPTARTMAEAMQRAGRDPASLGRDDETLRRVGTFVELHVEQGRGLVDLGHAVGVGSDIWPHGRWRVDVPGEANHAGTTRLEDRRGRHARAMPPWCSPPARPPRQHGCVATVGKVHVVPGRRQRHRQPRHRLARRPRRRPATACAVSSPTCAMSSRDFGGLMTQESWTPTTAFDPALARGWRPGSAACPSSAPGPATTPASSPTTASARPCSSCATPPGCRTPRTSGPRRRLPRRRRGPRRRPRGPGRGWCMTTFWCEHAVLPGGVRRSVRVVVDRGRILEVALRGAGAARRHPPAGVVLPGLANAPQPRLPPRPARAHPRRRRQLLDLARRRCMPSTRRLDPDTYHALARAVFAEMVLAGYHRRGGVPLRAPRRGRPPLRRPERDGEGAGQAAREAGIRITLLDTCYLAGGLTAGGHLPLDEVQQRFSDGDVDAWGSGSPTCPTRPRCGSVPPCTRCVRCPATTWPSSVRQPRVTAAHCTPTCREQPGENLACEGFYGALAHRAARRGGLLGAADDAGARHPPVRRRHRAAGRLAPPRASAPPPSATSPTASGRPVALHDAGARAVPRLRPARRHRPVRGGARRRDARAAREPRARPVRRRRAARRRPATATASLGWDDGGVIAAGRLADLVAVRTDSPRTAGARPTSCCTRRRRRRRASRGGRRARGARAGTGWATWSPLLDNLGGAK